MKKSKKHCYKKCGSDTYRKSNYATFYLKLREDFYIAGRNNGLCKILSAEKITKSSNYNSNNSNNTLTIWIQRSLTCQKISLRYQSGAFENNKRLICWYVFFIRRVCYVPFVPTCLTCLCTLGGFVPTCLRTSFSRYLHLKLASEKSIFDTMISTQKLYVSYCSCHGTCTFPHSYA